VPTKGRGRLRTDSKGRGRLRTDSAWRLEFVRLIAFPAGPTVSLDQEWWKGLAGEHPEDFLSTRKKDSREDKGSFQGALLSLTVAFSRIIWEARPPAVIDQSGNFPTFEEPFPEKVKWFVELVKPWLTTSCPPLLRLAFSAKLLRPAASAEMAYRDLQAQLPIVNLDSDLNDFLLQINRRKKSAVVDALSINRINTWCKMNVAILIEPGKPFTWPDRCYSALELDINTAPEITDVLPRASLAPLFEELASFGLDIAQHGDTP
jgi:hypothetical protein